MTSRCASRGRINLQCWLDWRAPKNLVARVQLEYIRACYPGVYTPQEVLGRINGSVNPVDLNRQGSLDSDRLQTALLLLRSVQSSSVQAISEQAVLLHTGLPDRSDNFRLGPHCKAHRAFQPFLCAVAEELAWMGKVERALAELQELSRFAEQTVVDQDTLQATEHTILRIVRRMRLRDERYKTRSEYFKYNEEWALDGLSGPRVEPVVLAEISRRIGSRISARSSEEKERTAHLCHARWRTTYTLRLNWAKRC